VDETAQVLTEEGRARRRFLKQAATVAWAAPFIVTMTGRAAQAQQVCGQYVVSPDPNLPIAVCNQFVVCGSTTSCQPTSPVSGSDCTCQ
jgi:hypothetical protein